ncbi:hypothetical protein HOY80DRAFT_940613 [Tuber brumale]|nr:hypothetical protein HOY80DRAFT_940613 [Tuber brumale]
MLVYAYVGTVLGWYVCLCVSEARGYPSISLQSRTGNHPSPKIEVGTTAQIWPSRRQSLPKRGNKWERKKMQ